MPKESTKATITSFAGTPLVRVVDGTLSRNISPANLVAETGAQAALDGRYLLESNNLSDLENDETARGNLGAAPRSALYLPGSSGNYVSMPDIALGAEDIDLIALIDPTDWTPASGMAIITKYSGSTCLLFILNSTGALFLRVVNAGGTNRDITSSASVAGVDGTPMWLRATFDGDNGAAGSTTTFYKAAYDGTLTIPTTWTQVGTASTTATAWTIRNTADPIELGSSGAGTGNLYTGSIYRAVIRNVIGGTPVADYRADSGVVRYRDAYGNLWTVAGSGSGWKFPT